MPTKLLSLVLILWVSFMLGVFLFPEQMKKIEAQLWLTGITESIHSSKTTFDNTVTDVPQTRSQWQEWYDSAFSGAIKIKESVVWGIDTTKNTVDSIRVNAQKVEDGYSAAKETFQEVKENYQEVKTFVEETGETLDKIDTAMSTVQDLSFSGTTASGSLIDTKY